MLCVTEVTFVFLFDKLYEPCLATAILETISGTLIPIASNVRPITESGIKNSLPKSRANYKTDIVKTQHRRILLRQVKIKLGIRINQAFECVLKKLILLQLTDRRKLFFGMLTYDCD